MNQYFNHSSKKSRGCVALFLLLVVVFPVSQTSPCSDLQGTESASGMVDLQQVIILEHCVVDACTMIMERY